MGNKENKEMIQNQLKYFINDSLVHLVHLSCTVSITPLYNGAIYPS